MNPVLSRLALPALVLGAGCAAPPIASEPTTPIATDWVYEGGDTGAGVADVATLVSDLQLQVTRIPEWIGRPLLLSYAAARAHGNENCPPESSLFDPTTGTDNWWYGTCQTESGTHFNGVMTGWNWTGQGADATDIVDVADRLPDGYAYTGGGFEGRIDIYDRAGTFDFSCSCEGILGSAVSTTDARSLRFSYARGPAGWTGAEADGTWVDEVAVQPTVWQLYQYSGEVGQVQAFIEASLSGVGERFRTTTLRIDVGRIPNNNGVGCSLAQMHIVARDSETADWTTLDSTAKEPGSCLSCFTTESGEEGCVDLTSLLDADPTTW